MVGGSSLAAMSPRSTLAALAALLLTASVGLLFSSPAPAGAAPGWVWPFEGEVLTVYRNGDDPYAAGQHRGIDIAAPVGTPVGAAAPGTVRFAGVAGSSGLTVSVRTSDGTLDTSYLHLSEVAVRKGDDVDAGERLGAVGTTGSRSAHGPHLHFGIRDAGSRHAYHDPLAYLPPPAPRTVPEPPQPVPAPEPVPVAPVPLPVPDPVRVPVAPLSRVPAARRVRVPAGRRVRVPDARRPSAPVRRPAPAGAGAPALAPAPLGIPAPAGRSTPAPRQLPNLAPVGPGGGVGPVRSPDAIGGSGVGPVGSVEAARPTESSATPAGHAGAPEAAAGGPDVGWALACTGLLLAAALLGRPGERDGARSKRGHGIRGAARKGAGVRLRALMGR